MTRAGGIPSMLAGAALLGILGAAGCSGGPEAASSEPVISRDVQYVLDKLATGAREERADALKMLVDDRSLYAAAEDHLRRRVLIENDLFLREQMIDGLATMAVDRLHGAAQVKQYGIPRIAAAVGYTVPPPLSPEDPTAAVLEKLIHDNSSYVVVHARAARARLGVRAGFQGLVIGLEAREETPELADLNLILLRQVTGLHMSAEPADWWPLYMAFAPGLQYTDVKFENRQRESKPHHPNPAKVENRQPESNPRQSSPPADAPHHH